MDERSIKVTAVIGAIIAVVAVGFLLITTYAGEDDAVAVLDEPTPAEGPPVPNNPDPGQSEDEDGVPGAGAGHDDGPIDPSADPETSAALTETTTDFFTAWLRPGKLEERQEAVRPYATPGFVDLMPLTDPNPLPKGPLRAPPEVQGLQAYAGATNVELEGGVNYRVNLVLEPEGWRVNELLADEESPAFVKQTPPTESAPETEQETDPEAEPAPDTTPGQDADTPDPSDPAAEDATDSDGAGEG